jgi:hypothetical protein
MRNEALSFFSLPRAPLSHLVSPAAASPSLTIPPAGPSSSLLARSALARRAPDQPPFTSPVQASSPVQPLPALAVRPTCLAPCSVFGLRSGFFLPVQICLLVFYFFFLLCVAHV